MSLASTSPNSTTGDAEAIRPFSVEVAHSDIDELRRRLLATRWPRRRPSPT